MTDETRAHIAWMREHVRCETCKHFDPQNDRWGYCVRLEHVREEVGNASSCSTHWEPKEESDG